MSELAIRALTGLALIVIALMAAVQGGYFFAILAAAAATAMFYEWMRITSGWGLGWKVAGFVYALLPALALLWIRDRSGEHGLSLLLWVFLVTWATDIGAYFVGRAWGRRRLAPAISPGKTVEGLWGGVAAASLFGAAWVWATGLGAALMLLAPLFALAAQAGDLFESWMKRRSGLKDSGDWLPGHGGILDRLDGLVPVAVLAFAAQVAGLT
ncbi:MAG TPA: phosphatidate cytidylyltransferase [Sphingomicrobium sp.]|nr:phosphatidate cytidylyltransferase [Sphingomicrobium sp.]